MIPPPTSTAKPAYEPRVHEALRRRTQALDQTANTVAITRAIGITTSSPRTARATAAAASAATIHEGRLVTNAFAIRKKQRAAYGYARFSSTIQDE